MMWLGAYGMGLVRFDPVDNTMKFFPANRSDKSSLNSDVIHDIYEDAAGNLWIGTTGGGLNCFNRESETFHYYTQDDGLSSDVIFGILEDDHNNLWLSTIRGLCKFNPEQRSFKNFTVNDGLPQDIFSLNSTIKLESGEMAFGGINGVTIFHPDHIQSNDIPPPVALTDFRIFNVSEPLQNYYESNNSNNIELSFKLNVISFEFAALDFINPAANKYAYKMEGFDQDWIYTDASRRFATYTNLRGGDYLFRVRGANSDGVWNEAGTSLNVRIIPPFWETGWALILYISIVIIALYVMRRVILARERFRSRVEMERLEAQKTHELDQLKLQFFTGVSHEFRTPLMLIIGPVERLLRSAAEFSEKKQRLYNQLILRNAQRLLRLVNQLMDARKLDTGSLHLNLQSKDIIQSIQAIYASFEYQADQRNIQYQFDKNILSLMMNFDQDKVEKIMFNLLSNAFKFVEDSGMIRVNVQLVRATADGNGNADQNEPDTLRIGVQDNGIGIAPQHKARIFDYFYQVEDSISQARGGTGIGLALTKEFVEMHGGHITVDSEPGKGSRFIIDLPVRQAKTNIIETDQSNAKERQIEGVTDESVIEHLDDEPESVPATNKPVVLVVEDNAELRLYLRYELDSDYHIKEAEHGADGIAVATACIPDLIICDIMMPVVDGLKFCARCKSDERTSHIPIILLTARTAEEIQLKGLKSGADEYITKPFNIELLKTRIKNLLDTRKVLKERYSRELFLQPQNISLSTVDEKFINKVTTIIEEHIEDPDFHVDYLSDSVGLSRTQLYRKFQGLMGQTPNEFMNYFRLQRAAQLLQTGLTAAEVAYKVGFRDPSYFSKSFRKHFNMSPSQFVEQSK